MRVLFAAAVTSALVVAASCHDYGDSDATTPAPADAGPEASTLDAGGEPIGDAAADVGSPVDAGPCEVTCLSHHCEADGGCDPLVFVTANSYPGDLGAVDGGKTGRDRGDELCEQAAGSGTFMAWLSDPSLAAGTRITSFGVGSDRPFYLPDGTRAADSARALLTTPPLQAIQMTPENAFVADNERVWTGTEASGTASPQQCTGWSVTTGLGYFGVVAPAAAAPAHWTKDSYMACTNLAHLYCFEIVR